MNKKHNLFVNPISRSLDNNDRIYYSSKENNEFRGNIKKESNVMQKINTIFSSSNYVYKAKVRITFKDREEIKMIVGKNRNNLITMDNELIKIIDVIDIEAIEK